MDARGQTWREERAQLEPTLDEIAEGAAAFALIGGLPGIGKSTLVDALRDAAAARAFRVLSGHASEYERELPFSALADALAELDAHRLTRLGVTRPEERRAIVPELGALRRLGPRMRATAGPLTELSPREQEIAALVADGRTNREIAAALYIAEKTVATHMRNIFAKLRVDRRAAVGALVRG